MKADELRAAIAALPELPDADDVWTGKRQELRDRLADAENDPADFLTWPEIYSTMWVGDAPYIPVERRGVPEEWRGLALDTNDTHQLYHLRQWQRRAGREVADLDTIVEFGGGYGALARLVHELGFKGRYVIVDVPEFQLLQAWWLAGQGVSVEHVTLAELPPTHADLFIAIRSLSEMTPAVIAETLDKVGADNYLLNYGGDVGELLQGSVPRGGAWTWDVYETPHLPTNTYLVGWKADAPPEPEPKAAKAPSKSKSAKAKGKSK